MLPVITILGRQYPTYAILGLIGLFLATFVASRRAKRYGFSIHDAVFMAAFAGIGLVLGGMLLFALTQVSNMWRDRAFLFVDFFGFLSRHLGGMVFYGGLFGALLGLLYYARFMKMPLNRVMAMAVPVFPLAHSIMRLGCFAAGCCHGIPYPPPLGIAFSNAIGAPNNIPLLPVQLYEAFFNLILFLGLWHYTKKERNWVNILIVYGISYAFARFWLEFLRGDLGRGFVFLLSTSQFISLLVLIACIGLWIRQTVKNRVY